jgi:hypothetical protein
MLNRIAFVSALTEGLTTVIPLSDDEIIAAYEIVTDYLSENFPDFGTELLEKEENYEIRVSQYNDFAYAIQFVDNKIFILNDNDFSPSADLAGSLYGILMIMSTYLIVRLNSFSFSSKEITGDVFETEAVSLHESTIFLEKEDEPNEEDSDSPKEEMEETLEKDEEEESSFDDEWL